MALVATGGHAVVSDRPEIRVDITDAQLALLVSELRHARYHVEQFRELELRDAAFAEMVRVLADGLLAEIDDDLRWLLPDQ